MFQVGLLNMVKKFVHLVNIISTSKGSICFLKNIEISLGNLINNPCHAKTWAEAPILAETGPC